jgi:hypothetical protein
VKDGITTLNSTLQPNAQIPLTPTTVLLFKRVVAWARLNLEELDNYKDSTRADLSKLFLQIGKVDIVVEPKLVVDELIDRKMISLGEDEKVQYDLHHLTGKQAENQSGGGVLKSALYVLVIVLFWGSMIGQIIPASVGGVGGMKAKGKASN